MLLHGIGMSGAAWKPMEPYLRAAGIEPVALDCPGFGTRPAPEDGSTIPAQAEALAEELDERALERPAVVGNSMGGWLALELARRGRAGRVVAISPTGSGGRRERVWCDWMVRGTRAAAHAPLPNAVMRNPVARNLLNRVMMSRGHRADPAELLEQKRVLEAAPGFDAAAAYMREQTLERPEEIRCPVLVMRGTADKLIRTPQCRRLAEELPDATLVRLPGLGHLPMYDDPELVAEIVARFLDDASATPSRKQPAWVRE